MLNERFFDGDDDEPTRLAQYVACGQAIAIILHACADYARLALALAGEDPSLRRFSAFKDLNDAPVIEAHDVLAAFWRYRGAHMHPTLPFIPKPESAQACRSEWLAWLKAEVAEWLYRPELVRALIAASLTVDPERRREADAAMKFILRERCRAMYEVRPEDFAS